MFWDRDVVIRVDGGICSQISFVAMGLFLSKACGQSVSYDLSWYREHGRDNTGTVVRRWDFPLAFPGLKVKVADEGGIARARKAKCWQSGFAKDIRGPAYVCGYPEKDSYVLREREVLSGLFRPEVPDKVRCLAARLEGYETCAVHVRRGDLSQFNPAYGHPTSLDFFLRAMKIVSGIGSRVRFFFFSDDPEYVRSAILPAVSDTSVCEVIDENSAEQGYLDLYLMSCCRYVIGSQGSLGAFAAMLGERNELLVTPVRHDRMFASGMRVVYLNDDRFYAPPIDDYLILMGEGS